MLKMANGRWLIVVQCFFKCVYAQPSSERHFVNSELSQIPEDIIQCYTDRNLWDRSNRLPYSVDSLIAIIRKIELHPEVRDWTPGRLSANIVHKFRFDGIQYDRCIDTTAGTLPISLDLQSEYTKMQLIWQLVDGNRHEFPEDSLTPREKCSLHWMMSYAVNTTFREEELYDYDYSNQNEGYQNWREPSPGLNCDQNRPVSLNPVEMGVVWSRTGPIASGTFITGLAAGLKPKVVVWPSNEPVKRPMQNEWGATLAGDLAQTALLKRRTQTYIGPDGMFNTSLCPREFVLRSHRDSTFSHFTVSEINGGIDGLLIAMQAKDLETGSERRLSQIIDAYYNSKRGLKTLKSPVLSSCTRYDNYLKYVDQKKLLDEALTFGLEYKAMLALPISETSLRTSLLLAADKLKQEVDLLKKSFYGFCRKTVPNILGVIEAKVEQSGIADVAFILDTSTYSLDDDVYQNQVAAALALELDIWSTVSLNKEYGQQNYAIINGGSILEISEGRGGQNVLNNSNSDNSTTDNKSELACKIVKRSFQPTGDINPANAVATVASRMSSRRAERLAKGINHGRAQVIILVSFARIATPDRQPLRTALWRLRDSKSDIQILVVTLWAPPHDFYEFVQDPTRDIILINQVNTESNSVIDAQKIGERIANMSGSLAYSICSGPEYKEWDSMEYIYLEPNTQRFLTLQSRYFYTSEELQISFQVRFNSAKICWSRKDLSIDRSSEICESTLGTSGKVTFKINDPCDGNTPDWCSPIYFRLEGLDSGGLSCMIDAKYPCRSADSIEILITHQGMTCSASNFLGSLLFIFTTIVMIKTL